MTAARKYNVYDRMIIILLLGLVSGLQGNVITEFSHLIAFAFCPMLSFNINTVRIRRVKKWFLVMALYGAISLAWTVDISYGFTFIIRLLVHLLICLEIIFFSQKAKDPIRAISLGWITVFALTSVLAIGEIITNRHLFEIAQDEDDFLVQNTAIVTFHNRNTYSLFAISALPFLLSTISKKIKRSRLYLLFSLLVVLIVIIIKNSSRGCLLCLVVNLSVFYILRLNNGNKNSRKRLKWFSFIIIIVLIVFSSSLFSAIQYRLEGRDLFDDASRVKLWNYSWHLFLDSYGFGRGIGSMKPLLSNFDGFWYKQIIYSHNLFLELLLEGGIVFALFFASFLISIIKAVRASINPYNKIVIYCMLLSLPFYSIVNSSYTAPTFIWCYFASVYVFSLPHRTEFIIHSINQVDRTTVNS